ncbi:Gfo/Idh/MocA family protein [Opitutus terrae]|uniref:Oxidoreductase domain protein n=1 Tax=Opitutus terrae (strain DSM 11246 / JCM 15787 / PB90-1) TaxID=452637 RepID=B1ZPB2_OPITP|nr:Gfo/Idh/MocA family oxidoreductase [Opitutus terrae]ACB77601.1 oxidoreductase domain protein [Opitutus terrae PB90-1]
MKTFAPQTGSLSRRDFCRTIATATAVLAVPNIIPSRLLAGAAAPSNRIRVGQIGCGRIARGHDMPGVFNSGLADIVALCDVDLRRVAEGRDLAAKFYRDAGKTAPGFVTYGNYRELLARGDIDAVVLSLPDHQHAEIAVAALRAGKDVYLQKPFTMTHAESVLLRDEVAKSNRILQVGSQQRSWGETQQFRKGCEFVRSGRVGRLTHVEIGLPIDPTAPDSPEQPIPANLNYDAWLGPTPQVYYTEQRVHPQSGYDRPGWLRNESYCLGMITGWGAHHFDTAHWGMDMELSGPIKVEGRAEFPTNKIWNVHGAYDVELLYPRDIHLKVSDKLPNGVKFIGEEGWIFVSREPQGQQTSSDPAMRPTDLKPLDASDPKLLDPNGVTVKFLESSSHHKNWLDCVISRQTPLSPAPIAHHANTACIVSWIAMKLGRPLTWDLKAEKFVNDAEANALLSRSERAPHGVHNLKRV